MLVGLSLCTIEGRHPAPTHLPRQGFSYFPYYIDTVLEELVYDISVIPFTDWQSNAHSMTVQRGQNAHYVPSL